MGKGKRMGSYLLLGLGVAGAVLASEENRNQAKGLYYKMKRKAMNLMNHYAQEEPRELIEKAGHPDPQDIEDNKMVSEGAQYSVKYYNKHEQQEDHQSVH